MAGIAPENWKPGARWSSLRGEDIRVGLGIIYLGRLFEDQVSMAVTERGSEEKREADIWDRPPSQRTSITPSILAFWPL